MQFNGWSAPARFLQTVNSSTTSIIFHRYWNGQQSRLRGPPLFSKASPSLVSRTFAALKKTAQKTTRPSIPPTTKESPPLDFGLLSSLPSAQIARAAALTIRLCTKDHKFAEALYILNSMRLADHRPVINNKWNSKAWKASSAIRPLLEQKFIEFDKPLPLRLAAHSFLHGLLRQGKATKAARHASLMLQDGVRIRTKTLEDIMAATVSRTRMFKRPQKLPSGIHCTRLSNNSFGYNGTARVALNLLEQAQRHRQERTERMYDIVINACLLQGEILVASLLFVILVKDWQLQKAAKARREAAVVAQANESTESRPLVYPKRRYLVSILNHINNSISAQASDSPILLLSLQALANIAHLLEAQLLDAPNLSLLIKVLYSVPDSDIQVWSGSRRNPIQINAYQHFHDVLARFVEVVCIQNNQDEAPFVFSLETYNSLLHYVLRHRLSVDIAERLLKRMQERGIKPDIVTYNALLRIGTLFRKSELTDAVLMILKRFAPTDTDTLAFGPPPSFNRAHWERIDPIGKSERILAQVRHGEIKLPRLSQVSTREEAFRSTSSDDSKIHVDRHTLCSFITHLTSTGRPHIVVELIWHLLPELSTVDYPADWNANLQHDPSGINDQSRIACVKRAVTYGPFFFVAILNALTKAGKTGLAERLWILAKDAERASWIPGFVEGVEAWCLPVHAYTCMLQRYASEGMRGLNMRGAYGKMLNNEEWKPKSNNHVRGWAKFIYQGTKVAKTYRSRRAAAKIMGMILYRSMRSGAEAIIKEMRQLQAVKRDDALGREASIPIPDERYFNAALELFGRHPHMHRRTTKTRKSHWRWLLNKTGSRYERTGEKSVHWHPFMQEIAQEMESYGYAVPWGYRFLFVGRYRPETTGEKKKGRLVMQPWGYPERQGYRFHAHRLPTIKTRGLPIAKRRRRLYVGQRRFRMNFEDRIPELTALAQTGLLHPGMK